MPKLLWAFLNVRFCLFVAAAAAAVIIVLFFFYVASGQSIIFSCKDTVTTAATVEGMIITTTCVVANTAKDILHRNYKNSPIQPLYISPISFYATAFNSTL